MARSFNLGNLEITYLGHASFKIKNGDFVIYLDPYQISSGEKANLILITHDHSDHKDDKSIEFLKKETTEILIGGENIKEGDFVQRSLGGVERKEITIKAVPAYNLTKPFHPRGKGCGFILSFQDGSAVRLSSPSKSSGGEIDGKIIYHAGDTDKIPEMAELGKIDLAMLPIGGTYTMDINEAVEAIEIIKPKIVMPMHYNTLPEITADPEKFKELVGKTSEVIILE